MAKTCRFKQGLEEAIKRIKSARQTKQKPILVAIYGKSDSGKSYFIESLKRHFTSKGLLVGGYSGAPSPSAFESIRIYPSMQNNLLLFHCAWPRSVAQFEINDPNILAERILNRKLNLNIGIYNPLMSRKPEGEYDIIIENTRSTHKYLAKELFV